MNRTWYRLKQAWCQLTVRRSSRDLMLAQGILPEPLARQFSLLSPADQRHAVAVYNILTQAGYKSPDLLRAALLHDIGKTGINLNLARRTVAVIARRFFPRLYECRISAVNSGWRRPFYLLARHAQLGAALAREYGCSPRTAWLIGHHDLRPLPGTDMIDDYELLALQAADDAC